MGLFAWFRPRTPAAVPRTWTHAKDVAVFAADPETRHRLERSLAREGIQCRTFSDASGRAVEILTRFLPSVVYVRCDETSPKSVLTALAAVPGLAEVPVILAGPQARPEDLENRTGGVLHDLEPEAAARACLELAPEISDV